MPCIPLTRTRSHDEYRRDANQYLLPIPRARLRLGLRPSGWILGRLDDTIQDCALLGPGVLLQLLCGGT